MEDVILVDRHVLKSLLAPLVRDPLRQLVVSDGRGGMRLSREIPVIFPDFFGGDKRTESLFRGSLLLGRF
jgi:hypothetical protein